MIYKNDVWGDLILVEFYEFYDEPLVFVTKNQAGNLFLHFLVGEGEGYTEYLISMLSKEKFDKLRNREIDYNSAFGERLQLYRDYYVSEAGASELLLRAEAEAKGLLPPAGFFVEYIGA